MVRHRHLLSVSLATLGFAVWAMSTVWRGPPSLGLEVLGTGNVHEVVRGGPAEAAGIRVGDQILTVDGTPLLASGALYNDRTIGERVVLEVQRQGSRDSFPVTLAPMAKRERIFSIERICVGFIYWLVGSVILLLRPSLLAARLFFLMSQVVAVVLFAEVLDPGVPAMSVASDLIRFLLAPLVFHFFATFPRALTPRFRLRALRIVYAGYSAIALAYLAAILWSVDLYMTGGWMVPRIFEIAVLITALAVLFRPQSAATLDARRRRGILIGGMLVGATPVLLTLGDTLISGGNPVIRYEWTVPWMAVVPVVYAYAVYQDELRHADLIVTRGTVYFLLTMLLLGTYTLLFFWLDVVFSAQRVWGHLLAGGALVVVGSTLFVPLRTRLQRWVDVFFYGGWYDYRSFVQTLSGELSRFVDFDDLLEQLKVAAGTMRFRSGALLWRGGVDFYPRGAFGFSSSELLRLRLPGDGDLARHLQTVARPCASIDLISERPASALARREQLVLKDSAFAYWVPLVSRGSMRALLVAGCRSADEPLDREDLDILTTMARQAAIACENIALMESLQERLKEVEQVRDEVAEMHARLAEGREEERTHLARELHDGPIQDLYAMRNELELLAVSSTQQDAAWAQPLRATTERVVNTLRGICVQLRPPMLDSFGLDVALRSLATEFVRKYPSIEVALEIVPHEQCMPERAQLALYRICQEALNNVGHHSGAGHVRVHFEADAERIVLLVEDDGCGFILPARWIELGRRGRLGLLGIAERAEAIGGEFEVRSRPGRGTTLRVVLPSPQECDAARELDSMQRQRA